MNAKDLISTQAREAYEKMQSSGQVVKFKPAIGSLTTVRNLIQTWRKDSGLDKSFEIRVDFKDEVVLFVPREASTAQAVLVSQPTQDPATRTAAVPDQLITTGRLTLQVLEAISTLLDAKVISTCEFTRVKMDEFDRVATPELKAKFLVSSTKKGILIL